MEELRGDIRSMTMRSSKEATCSQNFYSSDDDPIETGEKLTLRCFAVVKDGSEVVCGKAKRCGRGQLGKVITFAERTGQDMEERATSVTCGPCAIHPPNFGSFQVHM